MFVEILDTRGVCKIVDMAPGAANDLISQGRAKRAFSDPTPAAAPLPGGYRDTTAVKPDAFVVVRLNEPTDKPLVAWDTDSHKPVTMTVPARAKKSR